MAEKENGTNTVKTDTRNVHSGHRERMKSSQLILDGEDVPEHILLEMLLYYTIRQKNTNELAHSLIDRFGGLNQVLDAPEWMLSELPGIGKESARLIRLVSMIRKKYDMNAATPGKPFSGIKEVGEYLVELLSGKSDEQFYVMLLTESNSLIGCVPVSSVGATSFAEVDVKKMAAAALSSPLCTKVVIAHNHPSGNPEPSDDDITVTYTAKRAFDAVGVTLAEHIVVAGKRFVPIFSYIESMRKSGRS